MKVIALVKFNQGIALVLDEKPQLTYTKYGTHTIIGTDGTFCTCYGYEHPDGRWKAFAGAKFEIKLSDGSVEQCYGQWWDSITRKAIEVLGERPIHVTAQTLDALKKCYVFTGYSAIKERYEALIKDYKGIIWDYWDYEATITTNSYRMKPITYCKKYRNQLRKRKTLFHSQPWKMYALPFAHYRI